MTDRRDAPPSPALGTRGKGGRGRRRRRRVERAHRGASNASAGLSKGGLALLVGGAVAGALALANWRAAKAAERRHPPNGRFLDVDGVRLHVIRRGAGRPVLYLHGNGTLAADLDVSGLGQALAGEFEVTAVDRPGYGYSTRPRDRLWTASAQADLLAAALRRLGLDRPIVVGHSWGALVALALGLEHPESVAGLVLVSGYYYPTARADVWLFAQPAVPVLGDVARYTLSPPLTALLLPKLVSKAFAPCPPSPRFVEDFPIALNLRPWQIRASAEDSALLVPSAAALAPRCAEMRLPSIILAGEGDAVVTPAHHALRLGRDLPDGEVRVLPGLGHMLHYAAPEAVAEAVRRVAARADERGTA